MEYMKVSEELIEKAFDELNRKCFGSELRKPNFFKVSHSIKRAGSVDFNYKKQMTLNISDMFAFDEETFTAVVAHEMIHVLQSQSHAPGSTHGRWFKKTMSDLNRKYHLNIRLSAMGIPLSPKGINKRKKERASTPAFMRCLDDVCSFFLRITFCVRETTARLLY